MCLDWKSYYIIATNKLSEYKDKIDTLEKVSGFNIDSLIEYFSNGCTLITPEAKKEAESCKYVLEGLMIYEASTTEEEKKAHEEALKTFAENNIKAAQGAAFEFSAELIEKIKEQTKRAVE